MNFKEFMLQDIIEEISMGPFGSNIKVDNFVDYGIPVLNGSNLSGIRIAEEKFNYLTELKADSLRKANASRGDIVITHRGTLGQVSYIPDNSRFDRYIVSQSQLRIRCNKNFVSPVYLTYYFHSPYGKWQLLSNASQVGVPALARPTSTLKTMLLSLPTIQDQKAIARILSSLDDKIELNNRINKILEEIAQTLFKRWFVDFEFPDENGDPYKSSGGKMVESELGEIPEGWGILFISDIVDVLSGGTPSTKIEEYWNGDIPFFTPKDNNSHLYSIQTEKYITLAGLQKCNSKLYPKDMIFITARGTVGKTCLAGIPMAMNQSCFALRSKTLLSQQSMILFIRNVIGQINNSASGAVFDAINIATFSFIKTVVPNNQNVIEHFNIITSSLFSQMHLLIHQNQLLSQLRDTLLPKLMSGEVRVPDHSHI